MGANPKVRRMLHNVLPVTHGEANLSREAVEISSVSYGLTDDLPEYRLTALGGSGGTTRATTLDSCPLTYDTFMELTASPATERIDRVEEKAEKILAAGKTVTAAAVGGFLLYKIASRSGRIS